MAIDCDTPVTISNSFSSSGQGLPSGDRLSLISSFVSTFQTINCLCEYDCEFLMWESMGSSKSHSDGLPPLRLSPGKMYMVIATGKQREDISDL